MKKGIILVIVLMLVLPALAQETTPEPVDSVFIVDSGQQGNVYLNASQALLGILGAFMAGGVVGVSGILLFVRRIKSDKATKDAIESLFAELDPHTKARVKFIVQVMKESGDLASELTDGKPNT